MKIGRFVLRLTRHFLKKSDDKKKEDWPSMDVYVSQRDVDVIGDGDFYHQMDIFYAAPEKRSGKTIIDIHGGAYIYGDRKNNFAFASVFLEKGYNVILLDYQQNLGTHGCEEQVAELCAGLRYIGAHASELGLDLGNLYLIGDSAGGHFALLLTELADDLALQESLGFDLGGIRFRAMALSCPVYDFVRCVNTKEMAKSGRKYMFGPSFADPNFALRLSPKEHIASLKTSFYLCSCSNDFLQQESMDLDHDSNEIGIEHRFEFIADARKEVGHVYNVIGFRLEESVATNQAIHEFFLAH
ncbi:MAG: alpha/beta hydrolase [Bacilli bacterium]|nr:alpha/beta hydrolase [Bacilli bacterium]